MEQYAVGYLNGKAYYDITEWKYACRNHGAFASDSELLAYAEKATHGWYNAGWKRTFETFYLGLDARSSKVEYLTVDEWNRLKSMQDKARSEAEAKEQARQWRMVDRLFFADNSVEEVWEDKDGIRKNVMTIAPNGDLCF